MSRISLVLVAVLFPLAAFANDLSVAFISRVPDIDYVWNSSNPSREGWPADGEVVSWRGHIRNTSSVPVTTQFEWRIDDVPQAAGSVTIGPNATGTVDLPWQWTFDRHRVTLTLDPAQPNNSLTVFTSALSVGFWVEQSVYDYFNLHQRDLHAGSTTFEDWAQRTLAFFNDEAAIADVIDRYRLQKVVIVPDGALPLTPIPDYKMMDGEPNEAQMPDRSDRSVDLQWGFPVSASNVYANTTTVSPTNRFYIDSAVVHELGHARYLTDVYTWNVSILPGHTIDILENGAPVVGSSFMPSAGGYVHFTSELGLMNQNFTFIDRYSAAALNRIAGHRATRGNYNDPENIGEFLNDLPAQNRLTIRDASGAPLPDADVRIYQSVGDQDVWYATHYDNQPDLTLRTDANGQVLVGRNPFATNGPIVNYWRDSNVVAIVRVSTGTRVLYGFLESRLFNLAYWRGETAFADHDLVVGQELCFNEQVPQLRGPAYDSRSDSPMVTLSWDGIPGATKYNVWISTGGQAPRLLESTTATTVTAPLPGRNDWWIEAEFDGCPVRRSDAWRFTAAAMSRRRAVQSQNR